MITVLIACGFLAFWRLRRLWIVVRIRLRGPSTLRSVFGRVFRAGRCFWRVGRIFRALSKMDEFVDLGLFNWN